MNPGTDTIQILLEWKTANSNTDVEKVPVSHQILLDVEDLLILQLVDKDHS